MHSTLIDTRPYINTNIQNTLSQSPDNISTHTLSQRISHSWIMANPKYPGTSVTHHPILTYPLPMSLTPADTTHNMNIITPHRYFSLHTVLCPPLSAKYWTVQLLHLATVWHLPTNREFCWRSRQSTLIFDDFQHKNTPCQLPDNVSTHTPSQPNDGQYLYMLDIQKSKILSTIFFFVFKDH
jgi:hypothetical protein